MTKAQEHSFMMILHSRLMAHITSDELYKEIPSPASEEVDKFFETVNFSHKIPFETVLGMAICYLAVKRKETMKDHTDLILQMSDIIKLLNGRVIAYPNSKVSIRLQTEDTSITAKGACERIQGEWNFELNKKG